MLVFDDSNSKQWRLGTRKWDGNPQAWQRPWWQLYQLDHSGTLTVADSDIRDHLVLLSFIIWYKKVRCYDPAEQLIQVKGHYLLGLCSKLQESIMIKIFRFALRPNWLDQGPTRWSQEVILQTYTRIIIAGNNLFSWEVGSGHTRKGPKHLCLQQRN